MTMVIEKIASRRQRKKAALRALIIAKGIELFSRSGFAEVTVDQIAEAADVGKGTIYNYFDTKEDIVVAFLADLEQKLQARVKRSLAAKGTAETVISEYIRFHFRMKRPYHQFVRVFLGQMFTGTDQFLPYMVEMQKAVDPPLDMLFGSLQKRGAIRNDMSIPQLVQVFKTMHLGLTALWAVEGPPFRGTEMILKQEVKLFCQGLERKP